MAPVSLLVAQQLVAGGVMLSTITAGVFWLLPGLLHVLSLTISDWQLGVCVVGVIDAFMETNTLILRRVEGEGVAFGARVRDWGSQRHVVTHLWHEQA